MSIQEKKNAKGEKIIEEENESYSAYEISSINDRLKNCFINHILYNDKATQKSSLHSGFYHS